ncbi:hypothetical protein FRC08_012240 [Ceratobasidium sp. 394]|nr:hypothetical protein FRC08_012240 [Ceratobasidium sp. 394]
MPQFDVQRFAQDVHNITEQSPQLANRPAPDAAGQVYQLLAELKEQLAAMKAEMNKRFDEMDTQFDSMDAQFDAMDKRFDSMKQKILESEAHLMAKLELDNRMTRARMLNSSAREPGDHLYPLPLPNGDDVPPGEFPATLEGP